MPLTDGQTNRKGKIGQYSGRPETAIATINKLYIDATFIDGKAWESSQSVLVILFLEACYGINMFHFSFKTFILSPSDDG